MRGPRSPARARPRPGFRSFQKSGGKEADAPPPGLIYREARPSRPGLAASDYAGMRQLKTRRFRGPRGHSWRERAEASSGRRRHDAEIERVFGGGARAGFQGVRGEGGMVVGG